MAENIWRDGIGFQPAPGFIAHAVSVSIMPHFQAGILNRTPVHPPAFWLTLAACLRTPWDKNPAIASFFEFAWLEEAHKGARKCALRVFWLPPRDSNPDRLLQRQLSYH